MSTIDHGFSISMVCGRGGDGKSYSVVDELANNRLVNWDYHLWTNLPLNVKELAEHVAKQRGCDAKEVEQRIHKIPDEMLKRWERAEGGPWDLTEEGGVRSDIVIDEIHVFCPKRGSHRRQVEAEKAEPDTYTKAKPKTEEAHLAWQRWLGEARHPPYSHQRVQFITQALAKVHPVIEQHASVRYMMEKTDRRKVPLFGIIKADLFELVASFTGRYQPLVSREEQVKNASERWEKNDAIQFTYHKSVFALYQSESAAGGKSGVEEAVAADRHEFEKRPKFLPAMWDYQGHGKQVLTSPTWLWFLGRNLRAVGISCGLTFAVLFLLCGGIEWTLGLGTQYTQRRLAELRGKEPASVDATSVSASATAVVDGPAKSSCGCGAKGRRLAETLADRLEAVSDQVAEAGGLVGVGRDFIAFATGDYVAVGEPLEHGPHKGEVLESVDISRGVALLSNGERLHLWRRNREKADSQANVRGLIQEAREYANEAGATEGEERSVLVAVRKDDEGGRPAGASGTKK